MVGPAVGIGHYALQQLQLVVDATSGHWLFHGGADLLAALFSDIRESSGAGCISRGSAAEELERFDWPI